MLKIIYLPLSKYDKTYCFIIDSIVTTYFRIIEKCLCSFVNFLYTNLTVNILIYVYVIQDDIPKSINCVTFLSCGDVVTGDTSGNLMIWDHDDADAFTCRYAIQAHNVCMTSYMWRM